MDPVKTCFRAQVRRRERIHQYFHSEEEVLAVLARKGTGSKMRRVASIMEFHDASAISKRKSSDLIP